MFTGRRSAPVQACIALLAAICLLLGPILCARLCQLSGALGRAPATPSVEQMLARHHAGLGHAEPAGEQTPSGHRHAPLEQMKQLMLGVTEALPRLVFFAALLIALGTMTAMKHAADDQHSPRVPHPPPRFVPLLSP